MENTLLLGEFINLFGLFSSLGEWPGRFIKPSTYVRGVFHFGALALLSVPEQVGNESTADLLFCFLLAL